MLANLTSYFAYFGLDLGLLLVAGFVYVKLTPVNELALIRAGNTAAAIALIGALLGYACVVYSATSHGATLWQTALWSAIALVAQIVAFELSRLFFRGDWQAKLERDDVSHGITLGGFSLAVGILNAGCLTP